MINIPKGYEDVSVDYLAEEQQKEYIALFEKENDQVIVFDLKEFEENGMSTISGFVGQVLKVGKKEFSDIKQRIKYSIEDFEDMYKMKLR